MTELHCSATKLEGDLPSLPSSLKNVSLSNNNIDSMQGSLPTDLEIMTISLNGLSTMPRIPDNCRSLTSLMVNDKYPEPDKEVTYKNPLENWSISPRRKVTYISFFEH